jgi:site-specific recombinase XerD
MNDETDYFPAQTSGCLPTNGMLDSLAAVPEEAVWLAKLKSRRTRLAYRRDVLDFMKFIGIGSPEELRRVDHRAVIAWESHMRERHGLQAATIRRRLAALSSLFGHLVRHQVVRANPVREVVRPQVSRRQGKTLAFSRRQARNLLDVPSAYTIQGLRDRAILAIGLQVGLRRAEITSLKVSDLHQNRGFDSLWVNRKGGKRESVAVHPQVAQRVRDYLTHVGQADDRDGPMFRPIRGNGIATSPRRSLHPDAVNRMLKKYSRQLNYQRGFSAHSMRATFITTALDGGANLEDVQRDVGHADPATTKLYDRRGHNPEKSASFFANY